MQLNRKLRIVFFRKNISPYLSRMIVGFRTLLLFMLLVTFSANGYSQGDSTTMNWMREIIIGHRKETVKKCRVKRWNRDEMVVKGYYQEVVGMTTHMDPPQPIYGKKRRFRRIESTHRDKGFRRKFGI